MAKLNKSQAVEVAKSMVAKNPTVKAFILEQVKELDWQGQKALASSTLMADNAALYARDFDVMDRYKADFEGAYTDAVVAAMNRIIKTDNAKRHAYRSLLLGTSYEDAVKRVVELVHSFNVRGLDKRDGDDRSWGSMYFNVRRGVAEATLTVKVDSDSKRHVNPDDAQEEVTTYTVSTEIGWSSTHRSVASATANVNLYQELIGVAAEVEANFENVRIFKLHSFKPAVVEQAAV